MAPCDCFAARLRQAGLLELEQLCSNQLEALAAAVAETGQSQFAFSEARSDAEAAATYAVAVRGWALAAEREAQVALEVAADARDEELQAQVRRRNRGLAKAEELAAQDRHKIHAEEMAEDQELGRAEKKLKTDAGKSDELKEMLQSLRAETNELRNQLAPISARAAELRRRKHALEPAATCVGEFPDRALPGLLAELDVTHKALENEEMDLQVARMQEQQQEADVMIFASEVHGQKLVTEELRQGLEPKELRLEAVEAREKWQEIAHRDEHLEWRQQMKLLQQKGREAKKAKRAVAESRQEVDSMMLQDSLSREVEELEASTARLRTQLAELQPDDKEPHPETLEDLEKEIATLQVQRSTALKEIEVLRKEMQAREAPVPASQPETQSSIESSAQSLPASAKRSTKQLSLQLSHGAVRREALQKQLQAQKQEEERLRRQLKDVEQQLQLSRDDAERRRNFVAQLQRSLEAEQSFEPESEAERSETAARASASTPKRKTWHGAAVWPSLSVRPFPLQPVAGLPHGQTTATCFAIGSEFPHVSAPFWLPVLLIAGIAIRDCLSQRVPSSDSISGIFACRRLQACR